VQQLIRLDNVMDIGWRGRNAVNQAQRIIYANVHLHAKVPFIALFRLMHLWITLTGLVLGGRRRAEIMEAFTILPSLILSPLDFRYRLTSSNSFLPRLCRSSKCRK